MHFPTTVFFFPHGIWLLRNVGPKNLAKMCQKNLGPNAVCFAKCGPKKIGENVSEPFEPKGPKNVVCNKIAQLCFSIEDT